MKIAMLTGDYLPSIGGIASHVVEIAQALAQLGHTVQVWRHDTRDRELVSLPTVPTVSLHTRPATSWPRSFRATREFAQSVRAEWARFQPDILHAHTLLAAQSLRWVGSSARYRRVLTNHSSGYLQLIATRLGRWKARLLYSAVDGVLAPSEELRNDSRYLGLPADRCLYIPNGVDTDKFAPGDQRAARAALGLPLERPIVLSTRRFAVKNGLRYLALALDAVRRQIPTVLCVFCGNATDNVELPLVEKIIAERDLKDHVHLAGSVPNERIATYLHACDVVVLPSLMEATSISGLEAMSTGKPLVGTRVGGIPALIDDGITGQLVNPSDSEALATALVHVLRTANANTMGRAARERVLRTFAWSRIARDTAAFYEELLRRPPRRTFWSAA